MVLGGAGPYGEAPGISLQAARTGHQGRGQPGWSSGLGSAWGGQWGWGAVLGEQVRGGARVVSGRLGALAALKASWGQEVGSGGDRKWREQICHL